MKLLFYILACLIIAVLAGILLAEDAAQVVVSIPGYSVQTSMSFFIILSLGLFAIFYFILRFIFGVLDLPKNYRRWKKTRDHAKSEHFLSHGYLALAQGNWPAAEKLLTKGARYSKLPLINYIGAARAAQQQGAIDRRDSYLRLAHSDDVSTDIAVGMTQAKLQLMEHQTEQAYAILQHLDDEKPGQEQVKMMLLEASSELNDWQQSRTILHDIESKGLMPRDEVRSRQIHVHAKLLSSAAQTGDETKLKEAWQSVPKKLKTELYLLEVYITGRLQFPNTSDCEVILRKIIKTNPDHALVRLYGQVEGENPAKQLAFIERLLKMNPANDVVQLTAGRLYKKAEIWGKAKACFENSLDINETPESYYELATLHEMEGNVEDANRIYQKGLKLAAYGARPVLPDNGD
ncbi:MAG: hypothetical protein HKN08_11405, partial [Gammaproteobacteria bacterium]|nr:hypothetical protein [Gammaproteobacteria bacterium]